MSVATVRITTVGQLHPYPGLVIGFERGEMLNSSALPFVEEEKERAEWLLLLARACFLECRPVTEMRFGSQTIVFSYAKTGSETTRPGRSEGFDRSVELSNQVMELAHDVVGIDAAPGGVIFDL